MVTDIFSSMVFDDATMEARLPKETYKALQRTIKLGKHLDMNVATVVANAMKDWAVEKGATHYTHWFQPMTGVTAEKHDSFISPDELRVPEYLVEDTLKPSNTTYHEVTDLEATIPKLDVLYMTRVQKERFFNEEDYIRLKGTYILTADKLKLAAPDMPVLHPLPRVDEITLDVDDDSRAAYFDQVQNGVYLRMALIMSLLGIPDPQTKEEILSC